MPGEGLAGHVLSNIESSNRNKWSAERVCESASVSANERRLDRANIIGGEAADYAHTRTYRAASMNTFYTCK